VVEIMAAVVIALFLVFVFIASFFQLGENPTGALFWMFVSGGIIAYIIYCVAKENAVGSSSVSDVADRKSIINYRNEEREILRKYCSETYGNYEDKTGMYSEGYKNAMAALRERYGKPGTDTYIATIAKEAAWKRGIWNKEQLDAIGKSAVRHHHAQKHDDYKKPPSDIL